GVRVKMIEIAADLRCIVVHPVAIEDYPAVPRHAAEELRDIKMPDPHQAVAIDRVFLFIPPGEEEQIPFADQDYGFCRFQIERALEWRAGLCGRVDYNLMSQRFGDTCILKDVLRASCVPNAPIHEHQPHRTSFPNAIRRPFRDTLSSRGNFNHFPEPRLE